MAAPNDSPVFLAVTSPRASLCLLLLVGGSALMTAVECMAQAGSPVPIESHSNLTTTATFNQVEKLGRSLSSSNSTRLSSRVMLIMKLLQLIQNYSSQNGSFNPNSTAETRSVSSWLRFRRPAQRQENQFILDRSMMPNQNYPQGSGALSQRPHHFPPMPPSSTFPKHQDPNSLFYLPGLGDTNGIDYWLKFIEEANLEERAVPMLPKVKGKTLYKIKPMSSGFKRVKGNRYRTKSRHGERKSGLPRPLTGHDIIRYPEEFDSDGEKGHNDISLHDSKTTDSTKVLKQAAEYDTTPRCDKFTDEICIDDFEYPEHAILDEIFKRKDIFQLMYSEVKGDAPMVDGMARDEEESFSQDYYYNNNEPDNDDYDGYPPTVTNNRTSDYSDFLDSPEQVKSEPENVKPDKPKSKGGFVCRSEVLYAKPKLARNIKGKWRVIVNAGEFTQTVRLEKCTRPNSECRFIADHKYDSRCAQISAIHRLLVFEKGKGFYIDTFRVPTACTCHVHSTKSDHSPNYGSHYPGEGSSSHLSMNVKRDKSKSNLGETLWSLLGAEPDKGKSSSGDRGNGAFGLFSDHSKGGGGVNMDLLKLLPQLSSIAPENVLQQLLDEYVDTSSKQKGYGNRVNNPYQTTKITKSDLQQLLNLAQAQSSSSAKDEKKRVAAATSYSFPHPTTTTIVNPSGGGPGTPVVQVIHVPVSSEMVAGDMEGSSMEGNRATTRNRFRPILPHHMNGNSRNLLPKHKFLISTNSNYLQSQSKANSSVASPPQFPNSTEVVRQPENVKHEVGSEFRGSMPETQGNKKDGTSKQAPDKRVNFNYHPILDYIAN